MKQNQVKRSKNPDTPEATSKYYISNSKMLPEVIKSKADGAITNALAEMLITLTRRYALRPCFSNYTYREDMISEALTNLCQNALKFNPEKSSNPFAYYPTCIHSSFLQFLNVEKKHRRIRDQLLVDIGENPSFNFVEESKSEYNSELTELKSQIEEAKTRVVTEAEFEANKLLEKEKDPETETEYLEEEVFEPKTNLLDFGAEDEKT